MFIFLYVVCNVVVFMERFLYYWAIDPRAFKLMSHGVSLARAAAAVIKLNSAVILIPVLRNFLSWVRGTFIGSFLPIDKAIIFHIRIAWVIFCATVLHMLAHYMNFLAIETAPDEVLASVGIKRATAWQLAYTTLPGITGHVVFFCMIFMYTSAMRSVRRKHFEAFWYTHHCFIIYYCLISIHGASALLEIPTFWLWIILPFFAYVAERIIRFARGNMETVLLMAVQHPSNVVELQMRKSRFKYKPGMYLFLNCPYISPHEWHPFTITSAPEEDYVSVHIKVLGDWTGAMKKLMNPDNELGVVRENMLTAPNGAPILRFDGPFGTASEEVFNFDVVMLIGGGIGVTPFASILKSIRYRLEAAIRDGNPVLPIQKVYFYWISRDKYSFEWFFELLCSLEESNVNNFLEINVFVTGISKDKAKENGLDEADEYGRDKTTGLLSPTNYGRPDFKNIFRVHTLAHPDSHVGVFFCGPAVLSKNLYQMAMKFTRESSTNFMYHKENF